MARRASMILRNSFSTYVQMGIGLFIGLATAKTALQAGTVLDALGGYMTYGQCENADVARMQQLLPMGLAQGCLLRRDLGRDNVLAYADVELPKDRLCDRLRVEQDRYFGSPHSLARGE